jgi:hypothetical protein
MAGQNMRSLSMIGDSIPPDMAEDRVRDPREVYPVSMSLASGTSSTGGQGQLKYPPTTQARASSRERG